MSDIYPVTPKITQPIKTKALGDIADLQTILPEPPADVPGTPGHDRTVNDGLRPFVEAIGKLIAASASVVPGDIDPAQRAAAYADFTVTESIESALEGALSFVRNQRIRRGQRLYFMDSAIYKNAGPMVTRHPELRPFYDEAAAVLKHPGAKKTPTPEPGVH